MASNDDDQPINISWLQMTTINPSTLVASRSISQAISNIYLGSLVNIESNSTQDVQARLAVARGVTLQLNDIWKSTEIGLKLKIQLVKSLVWSMALYSSESWAMKKTDEKSWTPLGCGCGAIGFK